VVEGERNADFTLDPLEMRRVVDSAAPHVVFLTSPNNPTGLVEPAEHVTELLDIAPGVVVADEGYAQFAPWSAIELVDEARPLAVTRTFSKTWSMAALRRGEVTGPTWLSSASDSVAISVRSDGSEEAARATATGIPFYDQVLDPLRRPGGFDVRVHAAGDLQLDTHPTIEDVAITVGEAFRDALGDKHGIRRFASGRYPLDEALMDIALDLS